MSYHGYAAAYAALETYRYNDPSTQDYVNQIYSLNMKLKEKGVTIDFLRDSLNKKRSKTKKLKTKIRELEVARTIKKDVTASEDELEKAEDNLRPKTDGLRPCPTADDDQKSVVKDQEMIEKFNKIKLDLENELANVTNLVKCVVCMEKERSIVLFPCLHLSICNICYEKIQDKTKDDIALRSQSDGGKKCPICRTKILSSLTVSIS